MIVTRCFIKTYFVFVFFILFFILFFVSAALSRGGYKNNGS